MYISARSGRSNTSMALTNSFLKSLVLALAFASSQAGALVLPQGANTQPGLPNQGDQVVVTKNVVVAPTQPAPDPVVTVLNTVNVVQPTVVATQVAYVDGTNGVVATAMINDHSSVSQASQVPQAAPQSPVASPQIGGAPPAPAVNPMQSQSVATVVATVIQPTPAAEVTSVVTVVGVPNANTAQSQPEPAPTNVPAQQPGAPAQPSSGAGAAEAAPAPTVTMVRTQIAMPNGLPVFANSGSPSLPNTADPEIDITTTVITLTSTIFVTAGQSQSTAVTSPVAQLQQSVVPSYSPSHSHSQSTQIPASSTIMTISKPSGFVAQTIPVTTLSTALFVPSQAMSLLSTTLVPATTAPVVLGKRDVLEGVKLPDDMDSLVVAQ